MTFEIWWIDRSIRWRRWLVDLMRFLCYELGVSCDDDNGLIKAKIKPHVLQNKVDDFIDMFVLCPVCALPETDFKVVSNSTATKAKLQLSCRACGAYSAPSDRASGHKLAKFIVVNQLDNSAYQAAIARDDAGDAIFELASKLSISGMDQELSASLVRELNDDEDRSVEGSQAFSEDTEQQEDDDDDDDNDWAISTDGAAMEARQQANITGRLKSLALGNATTCDDTNGTEGSALNLTCRYSLLERERTTHTSSSWCEDPLVLELRALIDDAALASKLDETERTMLEYLAYIDELDRIRLIGEALFTANVMTRFAIKCKLLKRVRLLAHELQVTRIVHDRGSSHLLRGIQFVHNRAQQFRVLRSMTKRIGVDFPALLPKVRDILYVLYDSDVVDEQTVLEWHRGNAHTSDIGKQVRSNADAFVKWLQYVGGVACIQNETRAPHARQSVIRPRLVASRSDSAACRMVLAEKPRKTTMKMTMTMTMPRLESPSYSKNPNPTWCWWSKRSLASQATAARYCQAARAW